MRLSAVFESSFTILGYIVKGHDRISGYHGLHEMSCDSFLEAGSSWSSVGKVDVELGVDVNQPEAAGEGANSCVCCVVVRQKPGT